MRIGMRLFVIAGAVLACSAVLSAGNLTPPAGPVTGTMKTLEQVEPRTPIEGIAGDAEAMHIISQPGSYYLTGNATLAPGKTTFIRINASNVTLDLNGFSLDGQDDPAGVAIRPVANTNFNGLKVFNGTFSHWYQGINCLDGNSTLSSGLYDKLAFNNTSLTGILAGEFSTITNCTATQCGADCFVMYNGGSFANCTARSAGTGFNAGHGSTLLNCQAQDCGTGYYCYFDNTLTNCGSVYCGTAFYGVSGLMMTGCNAQKCYFGIILSERSTITGCTVGGGGGFGIEIGANNTVTNCNLSTNGGGIHAYFANNSIEGNNCSYNTGNGIWIDVDSSGNTVRNNTCSQNDFDGIYCTSSINRFEGNHCAQNPNGAGMNISGVSNLLVRNSACQNSLDFSIGSGNAVGPVLQPSDLATSSNPHANYVCNDFGTAARTKANSPRAPANDTTPPGPRTGPAAGKKPTRHVPAR